MGEPFLNIVFFFFGQLIHHKWESRSSVMVAVKCEGSLAEICPCFPESRELPFPSLPCFGWCRSFPLSSLGSFPRRPVQANHPTRSGIAGWSLLAGWLSSNSNSSRERETSCSPHYSQGADNQSINHSFTHSLIQSINRLSPIVLSPLPSIIIARSLTHSLIIRPSAVPPHLHLQSTHNHPILSSARYLSLSLVWWSGQFSSRPSLDLQPYPFILVHTLQNPLPLLLPPSPLFLFFPPSASISLNLPLPFPSFSPPPALLPPPAFLGRFH